MKLRVFMWTKFSLVFGLSTILLITGCSEQKEAEQSASDSSEQKKPNTGILYQPSELALEMRRMYTNMQTVRGLLDSNQVIPDSLLQGYEVILTAEATNPAEINEAFYGFANGWLLEVGIFKKEKTAIKYDAVMNACVHCHQSYCPGPIPKIKKLKLIP